MGQVSYNEDSMERFNEVLNDMEKFHVNFRIYSDTERASRWKAISIQIEAAKREISLILENATSPLIESASENIKLKKLYSSDKARMENEMTQLKARILELERQNKQLNAFNSEQKNLLDIERLKSKGLRKIIDEERNGRATQAKWMGS